MPAINLYGYQLSAVRRMKNGCILCGGVGSGKSRTALAYYYICNGGSELSFIRNKYYKMKQPKDLYIITTAKKRDSLEWEGDMLPFSIGNPDVYRNKVTIDSWNNIKKYIDVKDAFRLSTRSLKLTNGSCCRQLLAIPGQIIFRYSWLMVFIGIKQSLYMSISSISLSIIIIRLTDI